MSKKASTTLIGIFVTVGLIVFVTTIFIFSSSRFFTKKMTFYSFFDTSLNGLDLGAPVKFKGVKVGNVENIEVMYNTEFNEVSTVVIFTVQSNLFRSHRKKNIKLKDYDDFYNDQIKRGLAAKLSMESILTGKLYVGLDYYPDRQAKFSNEDGLGKYCQMPSVPTDLDEFISTFDGIVKQIAKMDLEKVSIKFMALVDSTREKMKNFNLESVSNAMDAIAFVFSKDSSTRQLVDDSLEQFIKTLRSLRVLFEFIERNPNSLLAGRAS